MIFQSRRSRQYLHAGLAVMAALIWATIAWQAASSKDSLSAEAAVVCLAMVMAGMAVGAALSLARGEQRAPRPALSPADRAEAVAGSFVLALLSIGVGLQWVLVAPVDWWDWALVAGCSAAGGFNLGVVLMLLSEGDRSSAASDPLRQG